VNSDPMFSVTVHDHMMIAHSFRGEVFGAERRLDPASACMNTTTGVLAGGVPERIHASASWRGTSEPTGIIVKPHEPHLAWANYERSL
jgi:hypothetical protein